MRRQNLMTPDLCYSGTRDFCAMASRTRGNCFRILGMAMDLRTCVDTHAMTISIHHVTWQHNDKQIAKEMSRL